MDDRTEGLIQLGGTGKVWIISASGRLFLIMPFKYFRSVLGIRSKIYLIVIGVSRSLSLSTV